MYMYIDRLYGTFNVLHSLIIDKKLTEFFIIKEIALIS